MEVSPTYNAPSTNESIFSNKNNIIIALLILLSLSFLGINLLLIVGNFFQLLIQIFGPLVTQILSIFGYTTGTVLNVSADIVSDTAKTGIDIAEGTVHSIGDLLKKASYAGVDPRAKQSLDQTLNLSNVRMTIPSPSQSTSPIQNPIVAGKQSWCLVGEYEGKRGCVQVGDQDKCLSGQIYPTQAQCLQPGN